MSAMTFQFYLRISQAGAPKTTYESGGRVKVAYGDTPMRVAIDYVTDQLIRDGLKKVELAMSDAEVTCVFYPPKYKPERKGTA
ncbi:hypothetical protein OpiT1DRAFT_04005 [Opitutaceae bacterium TAV1]|nr:hypothetical protein OpiT1DRAFT_04005 [Opitutaceae bacterium TAV1]